MKKVYVFGPIYLFGENYLTVYKQLNKLCAKYFDTVIGTYPDFWNSKEAPKEFYHRTIKTITDCDLFIAELSSPSHGVGMELQMAQEHSIPVIGLVKSEIDISKSTMVLGLPVLKKIIQYKDSKDLLEKVEAEIMSFKNKKSVK